MRVRCRECGSTRVRAITLGYHDGRIRLDAKGQPYVDTESGEWAEHDDHMIEGGSVVCMNCGAGRYRIEGAPAVASEGEQRGGA